MGCVVMSIYSCSYTLIAAEEMILVIRNISRLVCSATYTININTSFHSDPGNSSCD